MNISIGENSIYKLQQYLESEKIDRLYIITDENVSSLYIDFIKKIVVDCNIKIYTLNPGEKSKSLTTTLSIYDDLIEENIDRGTLILSFGGGVVGDIAGFVASTYKRGLKYIQIPTTLLAQVDSSVGGKVGIDYGGYKNIIGSFYFPERIIIDVKFLKTLSHRDIRCGLGEILKYGLISDYSFFQSTMDNLDNIYNKKLDILLETIKRSIDIKKELVEKDRYDKGLRRILNFGHTVGHSIEAYYRFTRYNHGEAVILGMIYESYIANKMGLIDNLYFNEIYKSLKNIVIPVKFNEKQIRDLIYIMRNDKKNVDDNIVFILPVSKGKVGLYSNIDENLIFKSLEGEWI